MSAFLEKARTSVRKKGYDYAVQMFCEHLKLFPDDVDARKELRQTERKRCLELGATNGGPLAYLKGLVPFIKLTISKLTKNWERMIPECEAFLQFAPHDTNILCMLGQASRESGHADVAVHVFEDIVSSLDKQNQVALRSLGQVYRERQEFDKSSGYYELLRKVLPNDKEVLDAIRDNAAQQGTRRIQEKQASGEGDFRSLVKDKDKQTQLEKDSQRVKTAGQASEAAAELEAQIAKEPENTKLYKRLAELYMKAKELDKARETLEKALEAKDDYVLRELLGDVKIKQYEETISRMKKAAKAGDAEVEKKLEKIEAEMTAFCIEEFGQRVKDHPTELALRFELGKHLFKANKLDEAIGELQKATQDPRRKSQAHKMLGRCFFKKEMHDLAVKEFTKARERLDDMADEEAKEITYLLGVVYEKQGNGAAAKREFEKIVEVDINYRDAMKRLERIK